MIPGVTASAKTFPAASLHSQIIFESHLDGADNATSAVDDSPLANTISFQGTSKLTTGVSGEFGTAVLNMNDNSSNPGQGANLIRVGPDTNFDDLMTGDFTIECRALCDSSNVNYQKTAYLLMHSDVQIISSVTTFRDYWRFFLDGNGFLAFSGVEGFHYSDNALTIGQNTWHHFAVSRYFNTLRLFFDGVLVGKATVTDHTNTSIYPGLVGISVGGYWSGTTVNLFGGSSPHWFFDEPRVMKTALYRTDASFTPPGGPYGALLPSLFVDADDFPLARIDPYTLMPGHFVDNDVFYAAKIDPITFAPALFADTDVFSAPSVLLSDTFDSGTVTAVTLSSGNLHATNTGTTSANQGAHVPAAHVVSSRKVYFEITIKSGGAGGNVGCGIGTTASTYSNMGNSATAGLMAYRNTGNIWKNGSSTGLSVGTNTGDTTYGIALDGPNQKGYIKRLTGTPSNWNGTGGVDPTLNNGADLSAFFSSGMIPFVVFGGSGGTTGVEQDANFGGATFVGTVPSGYEPGWPAN